MSLSLRIMLYVVWFIWQITKNHTGSQWLEANLRESEEYKTPTGRPVASGRTLSDRTSGAGSPSDRGPWFEGYMLVVAFSAVVLS